MILERFYDDKLAQASYMVGCAATGEALVVDANRDVAPYMEAAERHGLRITHITETHIHADYVSGSRELARQSGGRLYLSDEGDADWKYAFAAEDGAELLHDGDTFMVGNVKVEAVHTPGHTPEHMVFVITDTAAASEPMGVFSGDFIFVGALGRPDLLEKAAKIEGTMETGARQLYQSIQKFEAYPDFLQVWPGHGAGSACGKALGAIPQSTLGYERRFNEGFQFSDEAAFVDYILEGQPSPPKYFAEMKRVNKAGPRVLGGMPTPAKKLPSELGPLLDSGAAVVDLRAAMHFASGHIPGTINIPQNGSFTTWAGWLLSYDQDIYLITDEDRDGGSPEAAVRDLAMIGLDRVVGYWTSEVVAGWMDEARPLQFTPQIPADRLARQLGDNGVTVLDVREADEWDAGHIPGGTHIPLGYLLERIDEVPSGRPLIVQCRSGARSSIGASLLQAQGLEDVVNLEGGILAWNAGGHPTERD